MKRPLDRLFAALLFAVSASSCGQQLVEFGVDSSVPADLAMRDFATLDVAMAPDLSTEMSMPVDLSPDPLVSVDLNLSDIMIGDLHAQPQPLAPCAAMIGGAAKTFAVLGGSTVTNTGSTTTIVGNLGVSPGNAITGVPVGQPTGGSIHAADPVAAAAQMDVTNLYACAQSAVCTKMMSGTDLGAHTLPPGVYCFTSSAAQTGNLVLDAHNDPNAIWFFQVMSTLDFADNAHVTVINGGNECNVFWQVGSSVTVGKNVVLAGNLVSMASITLETGATLTGRALARGGAVTMDTNAIVGCP